MSTTVVASALCEETLARLEELGTPQNRKVYPRHGVKGPLFGVSYANLRKLAKRLAPDHRLAVELWSSGNHDARVLAAMVDDPSRISEQTLRDRLADVDNYVLADALASLVGRTDSEMSWREIGPPTPKMSGRERSAGRWWPHRRWMANAICLRTTSPRGFPT